MISLVINCDSRPGCGDEVSTTGDYGQGSLNGVRSWDFLTDGVINKIKFFAGHETQVILYVDEHEPLPLYVQKFLSEGDVDIFVCKSHQRSHQCWNELIYLEALKLATGDYVAHFDGDCAAFALDPVKTINEHLTMLQDVPAIPEVAPKFICQPTTMAPEEHRMWWASTRFFICKRETLQLDLIEKAIRDEAYRSTLGFCPTLEHVLARLAGVGSVFYPPANWDDYLVFSWSRYHKGLLKKLNAMPYEQVRDYILDCGILGPNDVISKPL